jgi:hypothetical protein
MRRSIRTATVLLCLATFLPALATEFVVDRIEGQFVTDITNQFIAGRQLVDLEMTSVFSGTDVRYAGVFAPVNGTIHYILRADEPTWDAWAADMAALSGRFVDFEVEVIVGNEVRSGIFWEGPGDDYRHALQTDASESEFQANLQTYQDLGLTLIDIEVFRDPSNDTRYAGLWVDGERQPRTNVLYGLTWAEVADFLDPLVGRVVDLERYTDAEGRTRYAIVLAAYSEGTSLVVQDLDATALANLDAGRTDNLIDVDVWEIAPGLLFYTGAWGDDWKSFREVGGYFLSSAVDPGQDVQDVITAFEANGAGVMGLFGRNVRLGTSVEYRADEPFYLASSAKLAVHMRLWQLHQQGQQGQQGHLDVNADTIWYSTDPNTAIPWFVDERPDFGIESGLSTGACGDGDDRNIPIPLITLDRGMMLRSDNAATSMLVDDPSLGLAFDDTDLNEWMSSLSGVSRGFGLVTSIQDLDRVIAWSGQFPNASEDPSYFGAPRAGLETVARGSYQECQNDSDQTWTGNPCGCLLGTPPTPQTTCPTGQTCNPRPDPWGDLTAYLQSIDPGWQAGTFPAGASTNAGHARYYSSGLNWATPRAFGELQQKLVTGEVLDEATTELTLAEMLQASEPLQAGVPGHIEAYSKGGSKDGLSTPCSDTTIFRVGPDAVVVNAMSKDNQVNAAPNQRTCAQVRAFWRAPPTASGVPLGQAVVRRLLSDLRTADPQITGFSPTTIRPGQTFEAVVDVTNVGGVSASAFDVTFYATTDGWIGDLDADDYTIGSVSLAGVLAGETVRVSFSGAFPADIPAGTYDFGWYIDPPTPDLPFGSVGEYAEGNEQYGVLLESTLTVLPPAPPCVDGDGDGYVTCTPDCDPTGLACGDCDDAVDAVSPVGVDVCNQRDDDCDGAPDPGSTRPGTLRAVEDLDDPETSDEFGTTVARLGDLDGDGVDEYAVGQPDADTPVAAGAGAVHVFSGATGALYCEVYDTDGGGSDGFGDALAGVPDVTGDGVPDFVVGAPFYDGSQSNSGTALIFDGATCTIDRRLTALVQESGNQFGTSVAHVGDVNLDGVPDIAVGTPFRDDTGTNIGQIDVYEGDSGQRIHRLVTGVDNDQLGHAITGIDDLDGDLVPEIVAGVYNRDGARGAVVVFSGATGAIVATWDRPSSGGGDSFGFSVAAIGDVTGDGVHDVVVGAINEETIAGSNVGDAQILSGADGSVWLTLSDPGGGSSDDFGYAVAGVGDVDGDGLEDVAVGAPLHDGAAGADAGAVIVFSSATGAVLYDLEDPAGLAGDRLGWTVVRLGDLTGDRLVEFAAGAPRADAIEAASAGRVLIWSMEADCDLDGVTPFDGDCDDQDADVSHDAIELCDTIDNDCDTLVDEDDDGDGYGVCDDCNDADAAIFPGASERCNGLDDDCDTDVDEGVDADLDGYSDVCDCDNGDDGVNPGVVDDVCDRVDQDCNGVTDDGFATPVGERLLERTPGNAQDDLGVSIAVVGDLDGDGLAEIAAGVPRDDTVFGNAGAVAVYDGATGDLHCLMADPDAAGFDGLGVSIAAIGDVTGDGVPDLLAGADGDDDPVAGAGTVLVFSGTDCSFVYKAHDPDALGASSLGEVVAAIGDLDGDGVSEFAAAAPASDDFGITDAGRVVAFDGATGARLYHVNNTNPVSGEQFGSSIAGGRDLDADGVPDFVVGTYRDSTRVGTNSGSVLVVSGATGTVIRKLYDEDGGLSDWLGYAVALIDDLDGDAVADILAGAPGEDTGGSNAGAVVAFSGATGARIGRATFSQPGTQPHQGWSLAVLPDIDGDGVADIASGAPKDDDFDTNTGSVYLISGADLSLIRRVSRPAGQAGSELGTTVAVAPDLTGDGMPEVVAGAPLYDGAPGTSSGLVVVFALEADCDADGVSPFGGDCDDGDGDAFGRPGDPESLVFDDKDHVSWQPPSNPGGTVAGLTYDVLESTDPADFTTSMTCVESGDADTSAFLPGAPGAGLARFYLVRARNTCDIGPAGLASDLTERPATACP